MKEIFKLYYQNFFSITGFSNRRLKNLSQSSISKKCVQTKDGELHFIYSNNVNLKIFYCVFNTIKIPKHYLPFDIYTIQYATVNKILSIDKFYKLYPNGIKKMCIT